MSEKIKREITMIQKALNITEEKHCTPCYSYTEEEKTAILTAYRIIKTKNREQRTEEDNQAVLKAGNICRVKSLSTPKYVSIH